MNQYKQIETQTELDQIFEKMANRDDSLFFKEILYQSVTYIEKDGIYAHSAFGNLKVLILCTDSDFFGIDFLFKEVESVELEFRYDFEPMGIFNENNGSVSVYLFGKLGRIDAQVLHYKLLNNPFIGKERYYL